MLSNKFVPASPPVGLVNSSKEAIGVIASPVIVAHKLTPSPKVSNSADIGPLLEASYAIMA